MGLVILVGRASRWELTEDAELGHSRWMLVTLLPRTTTEASSIGSSSGSSSRASMHGVVVCNVHLSARADTGQHLKELASAVEQIGRRRLTDHLRPTHVRVGVLDPAAADSTTGEVPTLERRIDGDDCDLFRVPQFLHWVLAGDTNELAGELLAPAFRSLPGAGKAGPPCGGGGVSGHFSFGGRPGAPRTFDYVFHSRLLHQTAAYVLSDGGAEKRSTVARCGLPHPEISGSDHLPVGAEFVVPPQPGRFRVCEDGHDSRQRPEDRVSPQSRWLDGLAGGPRSRIAASDTHRIAFHCRTATATAAEFKSLAAEIASVPPVQLTAAARLVCELLGRDLPFGLDPDGGGFVGRRLLCVDATFERTVLEYVEADADLVMHDTVVFRPVVCAGHQELVQG